MAIVSGRNVTAAFWPFWMLGPFLGAFRNVPPLHLPINQPLAYYANRPTAISQRPIVPRKRQEEHNKGEDKTRGSEALVTRGVQFNRETLLEDTKIFTDGLRSPCRRFPSLISRWSCQKWRQILSRTGQYRVVPKKEKWTRRQQVVRGVRFTSSERIVHAGKLRRDVHQKIGQS